MLNNKPLLLGILAVLALIRFALLPVVEWQNSQVNELERSKTQLAKGLQLLEQKSELQEIEGRLLERNRVLSSKLLFNEPNANRMQLTIQKQLDELMAKHNLEARNTNWLTPLPLGQTEEHRLELSLSGKVEDFINFTLEVENESPRLAIVQFSQAINGMRLAQKNLGNFNGMIVISSLRKLDSEQAGGTSS